MLREETFICSREQENAGPTNNWWNPTEAYDKLNSILKDAYKGRTMYVIPFSMGPVGSPLAKIGIEITDSILCCIEYENYDKSRSKCFGCFGR